MYEYSIEELGVMAKTYAQSGFKPALSAAEAFCVMQTGVEAGLAPMTSIKLIKVVKGNMSVYAEGMRALILGAGGHIDVIESTDKVCELVGYRPGEDRQAEGAGHRVRFTWEDAEQANLTGTNSDRNGKKKDPEYNQWLLRPRVMLYSRATTTLGREYFPDIIAGLSYAPDEIEEIEASREAQKGSTRKASTSRKKPEQPAATPKPEASEKTDESPADKPFEKWDDWEEWQAERTKTLELIYALSDKAGLACDERIQKEYGGSLAHIAQNRSDRDTLIPKLDSWLEAARAKFAGPTEPTLT